jgi:hypothetical protein
VAARSKAWTVFARSNIGIVGSNLTQGMDVCVLLFSVCVVFCVGIGLATGCPPSKDSNRLCIRLGKWKSGRGSTKSHNNKNDKMILIGWNFGLFRYWWYNEMVITNLISTWNRQNTFYFDTKCRGKRKSCPCAYLIKYHAMKTYGGVEYNCAILDLGSRWRWVASFTIRLLYHRGKSRRYLLDSRMGGPPESVWTT